MPTIKDIAAEAGISAGAVSRILNHDASLSVSDETRERVFLIAQKLHYKKNTPARKSGFRLGIIQWFSAEEEIQDSYYLSVRNGIEDFCQRNSIQVARAFRSDTNYMDSIRDVNGLVCVGKFNAAEVRQFSLLCPNIIFLDMEVDYLDVTTITMDFEAAVTTALDYLTSLGHRRIAFLGGLEYVGEHEPLTDRRKTAYLSYMKQKGLDAAAFLREGSFQTSSGYDMMTGLLKQPVRPTAVFAASDALAFGAMKAIHEAGLSIPDDISVIGFNNTDMSAYTTPSLTTIHAPAYDMGQHGANLVYTASNLRTDTPLHIRLSCKLIERESCARCHG